MNCVDLTRMVLCGRTGIHAEELDDNVTYNRVIMAVEELSNLFDAEESDSFDVEVVEATEVVVEFNTYYFQFNKIDKNLFESIFANAERIIITVIDDESNYVNVKLIYSVCNTGEG